MHKKIATFITHTFVFNNHKSKIYLHNLRFFKIQTKNGETFFKLKKLTYKQI